MAVKFVKGGSEKSDRIALRINAKEKFALELLAQKKGTNVSALILELIQGPLEEGLTVMKQDGGNKVSVYIPDEAYDPLLPDRIVKLALIAPELLSDSESVIWKVIQENPSYMGEDDPKYKVIRDRWDSIKATADEMIKQHSK